MVDGCGWERRACVRTGRSCLLISWALIASWYFDRGSRVQ